MSSVVHNLEAKTSRWTNWAACFVTILMLATAFAGAYGTQRLYSSEAEVAKSHRLHIGLERLLSLLRDAETGQRGYLITGRDEYLAPYVDATSKVGTQLDELTSLVNDDQPQRRSLAALREITEQKLAELESVIAARRTNGFGAAQLLVQTDKGRVLMQRARQKVGEMDAATEAQLATRRAAAKKVRNTAIFIAVFSALVTILTSASFAVWMRRLARARGTAIDQLNDQKELMRVTLDSIGEGVATTDADGRLRSLNLVGAQLTGWDESSGIGCHVEEVLKLVDNKNPDEVDRRLEGATTASRKLKLNSVTLISKDGTQTGIDCSVAPMVDAGGHRIGSVIAFRDVTMRIRHEQELRDSDRRKGEFLAVMSHELRNPVAAIQGALDVLHRSENRSSEQTQLYALMTRQVRQMVRIIDDLLDVVRISKGQLELQRGVVDLRVVAENAAETVRPILDKRHNTLVTEFARGLPSFHADGARLSQAVANLLVNASKYSAPRSTIRLSIVVEAQHIAISVEDEGIGLSADDTERIFEMFAQVGRTNDLSKDGLGVGLSLCRQIAFLHGGQVSATSAGLGAGSVFTISLPLSDTVVSAPETEIAAKTLIAERSGVRVLVADDNEDAAEALATLLRLSGYEVSVAHDGEQATRVAANEQPDIALLDLGMPKLTGYQVAQQIRAQSWAKRPLLIAITGWGQPEDLRNSAEAGFDKHFTKPVDFETLAQAIAEAM
jgi:PAS domain S-box-containing protein